MCEGHHIYRVLIAWLSDSSFLNRSLHDNRRFVTLSSLLWNWSEMISLISGVEHIGTHQCTWGTRTVVLKVARTFPRGFQTFYHATYVPFSPSLCVVQCRYLWSICPLALRTKGPKGQRRVPKRRGYLAISTSVHDWANNIWTCCVIVVMLVQNVMELCGSICSSPSQKSQLRLRSTD